MAAWDYAVGHYQMCSYTVFSVDITWSVKSTTLLLFVIVGQAWIFLTMNLISYRYLASVMNICGVIFNEMWLYKLENTVLVASFVIFTFCQQYNNYAV